MCSSSIIRGFGECRASRWVAQPDKLADLMSRIDCRGGHTQIGKVIAHAKRETQKTKVQALVFVGDAMEEKLDDLCQSAGELGLLGVPAFMFQEGYDPVAETGLPRDRAAHPRGLLPVRSRRRAPAWRAVAGGGGLCRRRHARARDLSARRDPGAIKLIRANEIAMATLIFGVVVLSLVLVVLNAFTKTNPHTVAVVLKAAGGVGALGGAALLGLRGRIDLAMTLGIVGLEPAWLAAVERAGFRFARRRRAPARSRGCARPSWKWNCITIPARCAGGFLRAGTRAPTSTRSTLRR